MGINSSVKCHIHFNKSTLAVINLPQSEKGNQAWKLLLTAVCFVLTVLAAEQQSYGLFTVSAAHHCHSLTLSNYIISQSHIRKYLTLV